VWAEAARAEQRLVTKDEDFITLSVIRGAPAKVIWLNIGNASNAMTVALLRSHVAMIEDFAEHTEATFLALGFREDAG
jgi:predicted nuclease of predicted toxin-antitoxin system